MCISAEALAVFLNLLAASLVTTEPGRIVIAATSGDVHWVAVDEKWCTMAPQFDQQRRRDL